MNYRTSKWLKTVDTIIVEIIQRCTYPSQETAPKKSMTLCESVGTVTRSLAQHSAKYTCSYSAKIWATTPRTMLWPHRTRARRFQYLLYSICGRRIITCIIDRPVYRSTYTHVNYTYRMWWRRLKVRKIVHIVSYIYWVFCTICPDLWLWQERIWNVNNHICIFVTCLLFNNWYFNEISLRKLPSNFRTKCKQRNTFFLTLSQL